MALILIPIKTQLCTFKFKNSTIWRVTQLYLPHITKLQQDLLVETSLVLEKAWCQEYEEHPNVPFTEYNGRGINDGMTRNQHKKLNICVTNCQ